jgi:hypothetical protein
MKATVTKRLARESCARTTESTATDWISASQAARIVKCRRSAIRELAKENGVRVHAVPGLRVRYCRVDIEALAAPPV